MRVGGVASPRERFLPRPLMTLGFLLALVPPVLLFGVGPGLREGSHNWRPAIPPLWWTVAFVWTLAVLGAAALAGKRELAPGISGRPALRLFLGVLGGVFILAGLGAAVGAFLFGSGRGEAEMGLAVVIAAALALTVGVCCLWLVLVSRPAKEPRGTAEREDETRRPLPALRELLGRFAWLVGRLAVICLVLMLLTSLFHLCRLLWTGDTVAQIVRHGDAALWPVTRVEF